MAKGGHRQRYQFRSLLAKRTDSFLVLSERVLKKGTNEIVIFETEGIEINELIFCGQPIVKKLLTNDFSEIGSNIHNHIDS